MSSAKKSSFYVQFWRTGRLEDVSARAPERGTPSKTGEKRALPIRTYRHANTFLSPFTRHTLKRSSQSYLARARPSGAMHPSAAAARLRRAARAPAGHSPSLPVITNASVAWLVRVLLVYLAAAAAAVFALVPLDEPICVASVLRHCVRPYWTDVAALHGLVGGAVALVLRRRHAADSEDDAGLKQSRRKRTSPRQRGDARAGNNHESAGSAAAEEPCQSASAPRLTSPLRFCKRYAESSPESADKSPGNEEETLEQMYMDQVLFGGSQENSPTHNVVGGSLAKGRQLARRLQEEASGDTTRSFLLSRFGHEANAASPEKKSRYSIKREQNPFYVEPATRKPHPTEDLLRRQILARRFI